jgi:uncharacterized protein (TIGR02996 family)
MSTAEEAFLSDIRANPDDDGVRLIYTDWLQENGQPQRAEFIRVQVELARLADDDPRREALADRQDELLAAHGDEWGRPCFDSGARQAEWSRGLIEGVDLERDGGVEDILRAAPVRRLRLRNTEGERLADIILLPQFAPVRKLTAQSRYPRRLEAGRIANSRGLAGLTALSLNGLEKGGEFVEALAASVHVQGLARLAVTASDVGDEGVEALARSPLLGRLSELNLNGNDLGPRGVRALLGSSLAAGLRSLSLEGADLSGAGEAFAAAHLRRLEELDLYGAYLGPEGLAALAAAPDLASLRRLGLGENALGDEGLRTLCMAPHWGGLRELDLTVNDIGPEGVATLARSPLWQQLTMVRFLDDTIGEAGAAALTDSPSLVDLRFCGCGIGPEGVEALAARSFPRLERLALSFTEEIGYEEITRLLDRARFPRLKALDISFSRLTPAGVRTLAASSLLGQLAVLDVSQNSGLGDAGAEALASSPSVTRLRKLNLTACSITDRGARAFVSSRHFDRLQQLSLLENHIQRDGPVAAALRRRFGHRVVL